MKPRSLVIGAVVVLAVAAMAFVLWPRHGTPVDKDAALRSFRETTSTTGGPTDEAPAGDRDAVGPDVPSPGVYTYAASGQEVVKLGPLPAENRQLANEVVASVTAVAEKGDSSCFDFELSLFVEHVEVTRYCLAGGSTDVGSLRVEKHDKTLKMGPITATATLSCDPEMVISPGDSPTHDCKLDLSGGPANVSADLAGTVEVGGATHVTIAGAQVEVLPVTVSYVASGSVSGTWTERLWMSTDSWMPVRIERDIALAGPANITENSQLELTGLRPSR